MSIRPLHIDVDRQVAVTITWSDQHVSRYPIDHLRRLSPSADARELRQELEENPLAVLPASTVTAGPLAAEDIELVGNYALRVIFSDGHRTGLYSWPYLREIDPEPPSTP